MPSSPAPEPSRVRLVLSEQREALRKEIERAFARLERECAEETSRATRAAAVRLHVAVRRLGHAQAESEWAEALADSAGIFAQRAAAFIPEGTGLRCAAAREIPNLAGLEIPSAPAFAAAISTGEPVAALRSAAELSEPLAAALGSGAAKCLLVPVRAQQRTLAVLYAEGDDLDANGLEAIAALAGAHRAAALAPAAPSRPDWSKLPPAEQALHLRAQRFARVRAAEMRLYQSAACLAGRERQDVYGALQQEIDAARDAFRREFMEASPAMPDYLHLELIRTLANNDVAALGEDYPGPLF
jgi:hypothetical protein